MRTTFISLALFALSACSTPMSGAGLMTDGTPVTGDRVMHTGNVEEVRFTTLDGLSCAGSVNLWQMHYDGRTSTSFPVQCNNGVTGMVSVAYSHYDRSKIRAGGVAYSFKLSNGKSGQFRV